MMPYTIEFGKTYKEMIQGDGRQFNVCENLTFAIHEVKESELSTVLTAITGKGYTIHGVIRQYAPKVY